MFPWLEAIKGVIDLLRGRQAGQRAADAASERLQAARVGDMARSWKDELWTLFFICPLLAALYPPFQANMTAWLDFISALPVWYQAGMGASITASFGTRVVVARHAHRQRMAAIDAVAQNPQNPPAEDGQRSRDAEPARTAADGPA